MDSESFPKYLNIDIESVRMFYDTSSDLLDSLRMFDSSIDLYIDDYIAYNNSKVSSQPTADKISSLTTAFGKFNIIPSNIAYDWYKKINNQIESVKSAVIEMCGEDFKQISDSIGSLGVGFASYNSNTTPYYAYTMDNIRPVFYVPNNTFNKLHPSAYANLILASKYIDSMFKHNLAPSIDEFGTNLIQSNNVGKTEGNPGMYTGLAKSLTSHGDNLVTDVNIITNNEQFKATIKSQITLVYTKLYKIINALKSRIFANTTSTRTAGKLQFNSVVGVDFDTESPIWEMFDILQNKIVDFSKQTTIDKILK